MLEGLYVLCPDPYTHQLIHFFFLNATLYLYPTYIPHSIYSTAVVSGYFSDQYFVLNKITINLHCYYKSTQQFELLT